MYSYALQSIMGIKRKRKWIMTWKLGNYVTELKDVSFPFG